MSDDRSAETAQTRVAESEVTCGAVPVQIEGCLTDGYEEYREQWVQTCEVMDLLYRESDAVKFAYECGWDGVTP